ncbi:pseudouridine-5'-phosphate glycosidase [Yinghuangia sp. ASG 101]|uniref:pseudouridine-5'-phosphate glycosidase n=1 Tax=Yinghuangia sp. ASG 101 TaxID=2896848 RepID=UPI001E561F2C|nr:pseudouridine-5'-phosphate glycosidase [Yinghuangia sp. ASG 101]UGQ13873.1 pseudouridine-5'-phosphate glycosidase [Yinghuangia sp. ASG 101]
MNRLDIHPEVARALADRRPVVALESTIVTHGLPRPDNLATARRVEAAVRAQGAVPATVAVVDGRARIGLDDATLARIAASDTIAKAGLRDLAPVAAAGGSASTTVGATAHLARLAGVRFFATGGLGGVHREARETWDESADLDALSRCGIAVVCSGVKSILDVAATLERLESLNVAVIGYGTDRFPGFYLTDTGHALEWRVDSPAEAAALVRARDELGLADRAVVFANPLPAADQLDPALHDRVLAAGLAACAAEGVRGKEVTPFLLDRFHRETEGLSLAANITLITRNATEAARIAVAAASAL